MDTVNPVIEKIAILGGTGKEGKGLAFRWIKAGYKIFIGSRVLEKAQAAANDLKVLLGNQYEVCAGLNKDVAVEGDLIVMTVPFSAHKDMLESVKEYVHDKILVDVTVPLVPPKVTKVQMPPAGSAAQEAQLILGEAVQVVSAFQNISYENLLKDEPMNCDVLVCGSSKTARSAVLELVKAAGLVGWDAGPLENSVVVEGMTSILIGINKQFGVQNSGIQITGVPRPDRS